MKRLSGVLYEDVPRKMDSFVEGRQGLQEGLEALREMGAVDERQLGTSKVSLIA